MRKVICDVFEFFNLIPNASIIGLPFNYIDPGSGSAVLSAIVGFFVVIGLTVKSFWYKIKGIFSRGGGDENSDEVE